MAQGIEFVCTGNNGRSPVAELVANNYLKKIDSNLYTARSSGTLVEAAKTGRFDLEFKKNIIRAGLENGLYEKGSLPIIEEALSNSEKYKSQLDEFYNHAIHVFEAREVEYRNNAIKKFGITGDIKTTKDQTVIKLDNKIILSMAESNNKQVQKIYEDILYKPIMTTLGAYATENQSTEIPNAFMKGQKEYDESIESITIYVPKAIDRLIQ